MHTQPYPVLLDVEANMTLVLLQIITDPDDATLFNTSEEFVDNQYLIGHYILVCPVMDPNVQDRTVYLPGKDNWYQYNLLINPDGTKNAKLDLTYAQGLLDPVAGGTTLDYGCRIPYVNEHIQKTPYVTPIYIRAGKSLAPVSKS
jgi:hypothetical protein